MFSASRSARAARSPAQEYAGRPLPARVWFVWATRAALSEESARAAPADVTTREPTASRPRRTWKGRGMRAKLAVSAHLEQIDHVRERADGPRKGSRGRPSSGWRRRRR